MKKDSTNIGSDLRRTVRGRILVPGDEDFDAARRPWNLAVEQAVLAVVEAADADDAAAVVGYAGLAGLGVSTQPSGHGASGDTEGTILLRTGRLRGLEVRPGERLARVGAGVSWGEVLTEAGGHGLIGLAGSSPAPSVVGYTLGGGVSWFGRKYGFAADGVRSFDVVTADGARARVDADSDPELFWALRGGGGDFAVVTAMEFALHPEPSLYGGRTVWPAERAGAVLDAFREVTAEAPEELAVWFSLMRFPPLPHVPEPLRGLSAVLVDVTHLGDPGEGQALLRRFDKIDGRVLDTRGPLPAAELGSVCAEPVDPGPGMFRGELLTRFDDTVAAAVLDGLAGPGTVAPLAVAQLRHLGGALSRPAAGGGACGHIEEEYLLGMLGVPFTPEDRAAVGERQRAVSAALVPYTSGRKPFTNLGAGEKAAAAFPGDVLARLREVKRRRDPLGVLRSNYPVLAG
ncbi:FAD-binding oxidoreductase [Planomonospora venezuelensis]|uniref:FAD/FMN-containing dehydrogenase n=1 Tax=Planomonospora venezuelensis TaxID=1999 RepID=A0A841D6J1_PLAVE|nr:FAD-binding oxidoreductase [Planomonospora venezuelensis]MBB5964533.1 FAD/FMN-containing dehydrogenase [Planomonospora venezuelensis]GIN02830.1 oxidoreductase [Planomonospora venezuelensis]